MLRQLLDPKSDVSSMRFMAIVSLFAAIVIALYGMFKGVELGSLGVLCGVFLAGSFGGKYAQATIEQKRGE